MRHDWYGYALKEVSGGTYLRGLQFFIISHICSGFLTFGKGSSRKLLFIYIQDFLSVGDAVTKYHRFGGLNNRNLFLMIPEPGTPRSRCQQEQSLVRDLSLDDKQLAFSQGAHLALPQGMQVEQERCPPLFRRGQIPS